MSRPAWAQEALRSAMDAWNAAYAWAIQRGPHNPAGSPERAEQLARAYMSGWLTSGRRLP